MNAKTETKRPDIFAHLDHLDLLKEWFQFLKSEQPKFSLRSLAAKADLATGYLPMILSGKRVLSAQALAKILPHLEMNPTEESYVDCLLLLATSTSHDARINASERMKRFSQFREQNPKETAAYQYLTHWYFVAIRELATTPGFRDDVVWIQDQLSFRISQKEIRTALDFLFKNHFLKKNSDGSVEAPKEALDCRGGIYRIGLVQFHREIMRLAGEAIDQIARDERNIMGHTCSLSPENFERARAITEEAIQKIRELGETDNGDRVFHFEVALFPLSKNRGSQK